MERWLRPEEGEALLRQLIARYVRLGVPSALGLEEDLLQEGRLALVCASRSFDPRVGTPAVRYAWSALVRAVGSHVRRWSSPVSGASTKAGCPNRGRRAALFVSVSQFHREEVAPAVEDALGQAPSSEDLYAHCEWEALVRERLTALAEQEDAVVAEALRIADNDSQRGEKRSEPGVYRAVSRLRSRAGQDVVLLQLLQAKRA